MSRIIRKPEFCLCENKGVDQLRSYLEADQRLCFRYTDSTIIIPHLLKSKISTIHPASVTVQAGVRPDWKPRCGQTAGLQGFRPGLTQTGQMDRSLTFQI